MMSMSRSLSCQYCRNCQETNDISSTYTLKSFRMLKWHVKTTQQSTTWLKKTGKSSMIYLVILNTRYNFWLERSGQCPLFNNPPDFWLVEAVQFLTCSCKIFPFEFWKTRKGMNQIWNWDLLANQKRNESDLKNPKKIASHELTSSSKTKIQNL